MKRVVSQIPWGQNIELLGRVKNAEAREWYAREILEHLMITGCVLRKVIKALAAGQTTDYVVRIENFKPQGKYQGGDASPDFKKFIEETVQQLEQLKIEDEGLEHLHPWLGPFNALQWTWLLAGHSGIHLAQLQAIKKGL